MKKNHTTLKRFHQLAKALWTSPMSDLFTGETEQGYMMVAFWQCQYDQSSDMLERNYALEILEDEDKIFDFNEMCNRQHLTLRQVEEFFDEVFYPESDEVEDIYEGLTTEELNGQR